MGPLTGLTKSGSLLSTRDGSKSDGTSAPQSTACIFGILNLTEDSFSDGGRYLEPQAAVRHADELIADGADVIDVGAASSRPGAGPVPCDEELKRLRPVLAALRERGVPVSVDSCNAETQRACLALGVDYLNDIDGFDEPALYPLLAASQCRLVVMHRVQNAEAGHEFESTRCDEATIESICAFFEHRLQQLARAGIARERLILDPGMGLFLARSPDVSFAVLRNLSSLRAKFELPVMISVSRKSFLGAVTGRGISARGAATLAAELFAVEHGADFIRTHDVAALRDALAVRRALSGRVEVAARPGIKKRG